MRVPEKIAYLKGLAKGLELDPSCKEAKLFAAVIDVLDQIACELSDLNEEVGELGEQIDMVDEDLDMLEEIIYEDEDNEDEDEDYIADTDLHEVICPSCSDRIYLDEDMLEEGEIACPTCGESLEFDFEDTDSDS